MLIPWVFVGVLPLSDRQSRRRMALACVAALLALLSLTMLERARSGLELRHLRIGDTRATLYRLDDATPRPLVVIAHGFAGSRQMMESIALTLARAGLAVVSFDFVGQGRSPLGMSPDVTEIEGTTVQLVAQTRAVIAAAEALPGVEGPAALLGHSMATDILVRTARELPEVDTVALISMYSDVITPEHPARLLILSGAHEARLREIALEAVAQVAPAPEAETVTAGEVRRRAVAAPYVGHVGVLWSPTTLRETRDWLTAAAGLPASTAMAFTGPWIALLLAAIVALAWPLAALPPPRPTPPLPVGRGLFLALLLAPAIPAASAALAFAEPLLGLAAFGRLALFFGIWGGIQLAVLRHYHRLPLRFDGQAFALLLAWALGAFALALDRYGAAFLPTGPRLPLMLVLCAGTIPFMLAKCQLAHGAPLWRRALLALVPLVALAATMFAAPGQMGLLFTVIPVFVLFLMVFGLMARWFAPRSGPLTLGLALGIILAWSIAASTPLFTAQSTLLY
ncbi:lysophospholipase [Cereibacter changlensis JA139]|uniref:Lysophospholipase n=2 Tax=Cereibacter changlensis TaxID=402884 RepID=A0A2T4JYQ9_9RHOB|nr:lysophospholipase [Cereibacter changlensis JA139]PZX57206.1 serine aminopeptidase S33 family [Cereibacter changlensis]